VAQQTVADPDYAWTDIDRAADAAEFVSYLDAVSSFEAVQAYKRQTFSLLAARAGSRLLDVGCGTGDDAIVLGELVGPTGHVVGVDRSAVMIAAARQRAAGLALPVSFEVGDAHRLAFADETFDGCRADWTFQHLEQPDQALAELVRVAKSGAAVVVVDPDWETLMIDAPDHAVTRRVVGALCAETRHGWMGRQLPRLFRRAGLGGIGVVPVTVTLGDYALADQVFGLAAGLARAQASGAVSAAEAANWLRELQDADQAGEFFGAMAGFIVTGRKP
jgi:ubiquinone/menaquinone biosynthesis C-methylase UbiE